MCMFGTEYIEGRHCTYEKGYTSKRIMILNK